MAFWSTQRIRNEQRRAELIIPFKEGQLEASCYELSLSREVLLTPDQESIFAKAIKKLFSPSDFEGKDFDAAKGTTLAIRPGQFALLFTEETVKIPNNAISFISIKASIKLKGLVNISGFHVDPGFNGRLKFSVYNAGNRPVFLSYGASCFLIWFADLDQSTEKAYDQTHSHFRQQTITNADREQMCEPSRSPAALDKRLEQVEQRLAYAIGIGIAIVSLMLLPVVVVIIQTAFQSHVNSEPKAARSTISEQQEITNLPIRETNSTH